MSSFPDFYASLAPFDATFRRGLPAVLYHKLGHVQARVRRRGLYLSPRIFRAQLRELRAAGFASADTVAATSSQGPQSIVMTFDDGFRSALENGVPILREFGYRAMNFLVPGLLGKTNLWDALDHERAEPLMDETEVREWLAAGHQIGAHTMTHPSLTTLSLQAAREEIGASKKILEDRFDREISDFAYPFGHWNEAVRDLVGEAGFARGWTITAGVITSDIHPLTLPRFPAGVSLRNPLHLVRSLPTSGRALWRLCSESLRARSTQ